MTDKQTPHLQTPHLQTPHLQTPHLQTPHLQTPYLQNTLYINLNHRVDRLEHIKNEFIKLGIENTAERFPAIRTTHGNVGCTMSHIKCLELAKERKYPYVFICEDDIEFTNPALFLENLQKLYDSGLYWDVLVVGGNNAPPFQQINDYCVRVYNIQTTTGYIVKESYYDTLLSNYKEGIQKLLREPENKKQYSIDIYWKSLQSKDIWLVLIPLTVIQYNDYSDIECRVVKYESAMLDLEKKELMAYFMKKQEEEEKFKKMFFMGL